MADWSGIILDALKKLEADLFLVPGAKLRARVEVLAKESDENLESYLTEKNVRFGSLVDQVPDIIVHRRPGTDMYIGFQGAAWPAPSIRRSSLTKRSLRLRQDAYEALTRITEEPYYYVRSRDEFTVVPDQDNDSIPLPTVTLDILLSSRRQFTELHTDPQIKEELGKAINFSANPLGHFQRVLSQHGLAGTWHNFNASQLKEQLEAWAQENLVPVSPSWFMQEPRREEPDTPQALLARFSQYMTDEDVRGMLIPFRALEAMYDDLVRGKKS